MGVMKAVGEAVSGTRACTHVLLLPFECCIHMESLPSIFEELYYLQKWHNCWDLLMGTDPPPPIRYWTVRLQSILVVVFFFLTNCIHLFFAEGQSFNWDKVGMTHSLRCIGIAPWGYIERKENLISTDGHLSLLPGLLLE